MYTWLDQQSQKYIYLFCLNVCVRVSPYGGDYWVVWFIRLSPSLRLKLLRDDDEIGPLGSCIGIHGLLFDQWWNCSLSLLSEGATWGSSLTVGPTLDVEWGLASAHMSPRQPSIVLSPPSADAVCLADFIYYWSAPEEAACPVEQVPSRMATEAHVRSSSLLLELSLASSLLIAHWDSVCRTKRERPSTTMSTIQRRQPNMDHLTTTSLSLPLPPSPQSRMKGGQGYEQGSDLIALSCDLRDENMQWHVHRTYRSQWVMSKQHVGVGTPIISGWHMPGLSGSVSAAH